MFSKMTSVSFPVRTVVGLIGVIGLVGWGVWFLSTPGLNASSGTGSLLTFITPIGNPQFGLSKTVDNSAPTAGAQINYTIRYSDTNPGSKAFNVRLYDFLPPGAQLVSTNPPATVFPDGALLFTAESVVPTTEDYSVTVKVNVLPGYPQLFNTALIVADGVTPTHASLVTSVAQPSGQLRLTKTGYVFAPPGGQLVYVLTSENIGNVTATDVKLADVLPTGLALLDAFPAPDAATLPLVRWSLGDLAPGIARSVVITTTAPTTTGVITNTALTSAAQAPMTTALFSTHVVTEAAILRVTKAASASSVRVNSVLVYTLHYSNIGNQSAEGVILTDTLPSGITVTAVYPAASVTPQRVVWQLGVVNASAEGQVVITATVGGPVDRTLHNVVDITGQPGSYPDHAELDIPVQPFTIYLPIVKKNS